MVIRKLICASVRRGMCSLTAVAFTIMGIAARAEAGETFRRVESKGVVRCGVSEGLPGFSLKKPSGRWSGLDADFCRAVAAAALGDPEKVVFVPLITATRFLALRSGQIDLLARNTTWTLHHSIIPPLHHSNTPVFTWGLSATKPVNLSATGEHP